MSKRKPSVQEELFSMIYKLIEKKTSEIFRQPVDAVLLPDYYEKIKKPIYIKKIIKKLKEGDYKYAVEVKEDFALLIANCRGYNVRIDILRLADKFEKSIETQWGNFEKQCRKQMLDWDQPLEISQNTLRTFQIIEQKYNRKPQMLQNILGELQQPRKMTAELKILPPIPSQLLQNDKQSQQLPDKLTYKPLKYSMMPSQQKVTMLHFDIDCGQLSSDFDETARLKLLKYRKILNDKLQWINRKIFLKCMERKRFKKMATVQHLVNYLENQKLIGSLQLRNIQMYVKMVAYWVEEYPQILGFNMKNKFVDTCKAIKKAIFRVLRYRRLPRSTKIQLDLGEAMSAHHQSVQHSAEQPLLEELPEQESKRYDNEIKNFKRLLTKDQSETIKKWTKITIKSEGGQWTISEFNTENTGRRLFVYQEKKPSRISVSNRLNQTSEQSLRFEKQRRRKQERIEDEQFLGTFKPGASVELIDTFRDRLQFDWDELFLAKLPEVIELHTEDDVSYS